MLECIYYDGVMHSKTNLLLLSGNAHPALAQAIAKALDTELCEAEIDTFNDTETRVKIKADVRGEDVFVIQPTCEPVNHNLVELLVIIDALRRASAERITAVIPYFGYARQDRKDQPRVPITAKLVANLLTKAGANRILTLDLHAHQIQGFFDIPLDHLYGMRIFVPELRDTFDNPIIVAPDVGAAKMAQGYSSKLGTGMAIIEKRRIDEETTQANHVIGDVNGYDAIIVDDIVATAGSIAEAATTLKKAGAKSVSAIITHGVLSGPAIERIKASEIDTLYISDSIPLPKEKQIDKITQMSAAPLLAEAIQRIHNERSISALFD